MYSVLPDSARHTMYTFTALIYDGNRQRIVSHDCDTKSEFEQYLNGEFGCFVCLWIAQDVKNIAS